MGPLIKYLKRYGTFSILTLVAVLLVFASGFYLGSVDSSFKQNFEASASEPVDMESFWKVWHLLEAEYVPADDEDIITAEDRLWGAISGLVDSYGDPYTVFLPPKENKEFSQSISGNFEGVGMKIANKDGLLTVVAPLKDTPAQKAGVKAGDIIVEIDGENSLGMRADSAVNLIRGPKGTDVVLTIAREGEEENLEIVITRGVIMIPTVDTELRDDGVFVISLYNFNANASRLFREALQEFVLSESEMLVLDLRDNPGGFLNSAVDISSWFLPTGKVVAREDFGPYEEEKLFRSKGYDLPSEIDGFKMVVLVNKGSASASEIVAGALSDHGVATVVGETTFGKGSVQELIDVTKDTSVKITIARWLTPEGKSISKDGFTPDIEVDRGKDEDVDRQMDAAVDILFNRFDISEYQDEDITTTGR